MEWMRWIICENMFFKVEKESLLAELYVAMDMAVCSNYHLYSCITAQLLPPLPHSVRLENNRFVCCLVRKLESFKVVSVPM